jgi:hypothetical protein
MSYDSSEPTECFGFGFGFGFVFILGRGVGHHRIREGDLLGVRDRGMPAMLRVFAIECFVAFVGFEITE